MKKERVNVWLAAIFAILICLRPAGAATDPITVVSVDLPHTSAIQVVNHTLCPITVTLTVTGTNIRQSVPTPWRGTVAPLARLRPTQVTQANRQQSWSFHYDWQYAFGSLDAKHDDSCIYRLPYKSGQAHRVTQTFGGLHSHQGADRFAVDFAMSEGTSVCAARAGTVVYVKSDSAIGGTDKKLENDANFILVLHEDGTLGAYVHLKQHGALVHPGEKVIPGQVLGLSGDTGWSTQPHLHFGVYGLYDSRIGNSFPIRFASTDGVITTPVQGKSYTAR